MTMLLTCQSRLANSPDVLDAIREEDCNLAIWERAPFADRIAVRHADAAIVLDEMGADSVDVGLLDPMFPTQGRAQVKKEMQVCRLLAGQPGSQDVLVHRAFVAARERVVVKRHPHEQPLAGAPSFSIDGERVRFDVYLAPPR